MKDLESLPDGARVTVKEIAKYWNRLPCLAYVEQQGAEGIIIAAARCYQHPPPLPIIVIGERHERREFYAKNRRCLLSADANAATLEWLDTKSC
jgi:hypothetical protein